MTDRDSYQVVARRYRPAGFAELVGQSQVTTALGNAIQQNRVGHAYLFTGARGVGKTSAARIFAKCLNCVDGPTLTPCGKCDICAGVSSGDDVDVLEIDGASNNGVDHVRELRANATVRPGRARYKIYIIDEVHMLSKGAFNALLKTLEEPPDHVKFIFCTTDPDKIPVTVRSRCQRFDFPPIRTPDIRDRLRHIVDQEEIEADEAALELLARRAGGSMRDSQSLLEQLLSFAGNRIELADVHQLLGTADNRLVMELAAAIAAGHAQTGLALVHQASEAGVDAGQLAGQLLGLFRDLMALHAGCGEELWLQTGPDDVAALNQLRDQLGMESVLAILQVLDQTLVRMRTSTWPRTLLETAVVRCCHLDRLNRIPRLIEELQSDVVARPAVERPGQMQESGPPPENAKKKQGPAEPTAGPTAVTAPGPASTPPGPSAPVAAAGEWSAADPESSWKNLLAEISDLTAEAAGNFETLQMEEDRLLVTLKSTYDFEICSRPDPRKRLETALQAATGKPVRLDFQVSDSGATGPALAPAVRMSARQRVREMEKDGFVRTAMDLFDGEILSVKPPPE